MGDYKNYLIVLALSLLPFGCDEVVSPPNAELSKSESEQLLFGNWRYNRLAINDEYDGNILMSPEMEPVDSSALANSGLRFVINNRKVQYSKDRAYLLFWDEVRGDYELGTEGTPNYQPSFGRWEMNDLGDTLIQNPATAFEVKYQILVLNDSAFVRSSMRYMATANWAWNGGTWNVGDIVPYVEYFIKD